jgi:4-hydroxybenzoate polyprenyltransferase
MRPHQWAKNLLVAVPMLTSRGWGEVERWPPVALAFFSLCLLASAVYLSNDVWDIEADRAHPRKKRRPFASGEASPLRGLVLAAGLLCGGVWLGWLAGGLIWALVYFAVSAAYSLGLKRLLLVDVFVLAVLYALRILMGGEASGYYASDLLVAFSAFFFLGLALGQRVTETGFWPTGTAFEVAGRAYRQGDGLILMAMGVTSGFVSCLLLALYLQDEAVKAQYAQPDWLWGVCGIVLLWICRVWMLISRGSMNDDPVFFAVRDRWSWVSGLGTVFCFLAASGKLPIAA